MPMFTSSVCLQTNQGCFILFRIADLFSLRADIYIERLFTNKPGVFFFSALRTSSPYVPMFTSMFVYKQTTGVFSLRADV